MKHFFSNISPKRNVYRSGIYVLALISILALNGSSYAFEVEVKFRQFIISYSSSDEYYVNQIMRVLDKHINNFDRFYNTDLDGIYSIRIPGSLEDYRRFVGYGVPEWSNALYQPFQRRMILKKPDWYSTDESFDQAILHELSHLYFFQKFDSKGIPLWFNEGLAEFLSQAKIGIPEGTAISNALLTKNIISLSHMDSLLLFNSARARLAYLQSLTTIHFLDLILIEKGISWSQFIDRIQIEGFENALKNVSGYDLIDFEIYWYRWLNDKYKLFIIFNWENLIWILMIFIIFGALYGVRYRNKKIMREWEREELFLLDSERPLEIENKTDNF